jgi:hypothetical protein
MKSSSRLLLIVVVLVTGCGGKASNGQGCEVDTDCESGVCDFHTTPNNCTPSNGCYPGYCYPGPDAGAKG